MPSTASLLAVDEFVQKQKLPLTPAKQAEPLARKDFDAAFEHEVANFERMRPELLQQYPNRVVAIYQAQVIESGNDILQVYNAVIDKHGAIPCYVQLVASEAQRKARFSKRGFYDILHGNELYVKMDFFATDCNRSLYGKPIIKNSNCRGYDKNVVTA